MNQERAAGSTGRGSANHPVQQPGPVISSDLQSRLGPGGQRLFVGLRCVVYEPKPVHDGRLVVVRAVFGPSAHKHLEATAAHAKHRLVAIVLVAPGLADVPCAKVRQGAS